MTQEKKVLSFKEKLQLLSPLKDYYVDDNKDIHLKYKVCNFGEFAVISPSLSHLFQNEEQLSTEERVAVVAENEDAIIKLFGKYVYNPGDDAPIGEGNAREFYQQLSGLTTLNFVGHILGNKKVNAEADNQKS
ncbi:hypothetical protein CKF54_00475 [Psittacicella hinzii]|uniref:Uncharacterized protein n=1 Tax=Psittacicella hinzii TaxID=2028575 RepID=A0A3A1Y9Z9_9GAMM|nr:hypothetical protein [Psittacicella hinzii]RIY34505.1 hypothetical protein CKF54_00475 [Psittacicella hinzii]